MYDSNLNKFKELSIFLHFFFNFLTCLTICALFATLELSKISNSTKVLITHEQPPKSVLTKQKICFSEGRNVFMTHLRFLAVHCIEMDRCFTSSPCMYPAFITSMMILWLYENHEKEAVASHNTEKVCYVKFLLCFRLLKWILITKRREKNISHLATRQMCSLLCSRLHAPRIIFGGKNWNYIRCIIVRVRNLHKKYEVEKKLIKIKAEKNWDVDKAQQKAKQEAERGREKEMR